MFLSFFRNRHRLQILPELVKRVLHSHFPLQLAHLRWIGHQAVEGGCFITVNWFRISSYMERQNFNIDHLRK